MFVDCDSLQKPAAIAELRAEFIVQRVVQRKQPTQFRAAPHAGKGFARVDDFVQPVFDGGCILEAGDSARKALEFLVDAGAGRTVLNAATVMETGPTLL